MNMDEIKSLEDALLVIDELHKAQATHNIEVEGLSAKCKEYENENKALTTEVDKLKKQVYDYWIQIPREDGNKVINDSNQNSADLISLDELLKQ
mgnify:FL=1